MTRKGWSQPADQPPSQSFGTDLGISACRRGRATLSYIGTFLLQRRRRWFEIKSITLGHREPILLWFGDLIAYSSTRT